MKHPGSKATAMAEQRRTANCVPAAFLTKRIHTAGLFVGALLPPRLEVKA
jgi:hypothetical protein